MQKATTYEGGNEKMRWRNDRESLLIKSSDSK